MKVIAAIPNYNMRKGLAQLLPGLLTEKFDAIYVLDDASTDGSPDYVEKAFRKVRIVRGEENIGAGANRNRLLPFLSGNELVLFLDADLELQSEHFVDKIRKWFANPKIGIVGSQILTKSGKPMFWNYGSAMSPVHDYRVEVYDAVAKQTRRDSRAFNTIRQMALANGDTYNFEIQYGRPVARKVGWVAEGLFAIRGNLFRKLDGYDERFRYHADQDLGVRVKTAGYEVYFKPGITARHLEIDVRGESRWDEFHEGQFLFYQKHWGMSREVFERLLPPWQ